MSFTFDPSVLESITQEARQCFLEEDAPGYLIILKQGLEQLGKSETPDYESLMRAAHSIKGGAGIAQMPELSQLAHRLEDLLEGFSQQRMTDLELGLIILQQGITELSFLLNQAQITQADITVNPELLEVLDQFLAEIKVDTDITTAGQLDGLVQANLSRNQVIIQKTLEQDLEACLARVETQLQTPASIDQLRSDLRLLTEECTLLGEMFDLGWLTATSEVLTGIAETTSTEAELRSLIIETFAAIREQRSQLFQSWEASASVVPSASELSFSDASEHVTDLTWSADPTVEEPLDAIAVSNLQSDPLETRSGSLPTHLRIPLKQVDEMGNVVGELITGYERLTLQQQQLKQASQNLRRLVEQVKPIRDQVQFIYDQLSTTPAQSGNGRLSVTTDAAISEFDALEMDHYTVLHSSLQTFEELITQIQETRVDIDLVNREFAQELGYLRTDLNQLYSIVTQSRLVPFGTFARRFIPQLQRLNQRCGKSTELVIEGDRVLVDRVLLEQLQTPLTHLLNNALDHGIESPQERILLDKPQMGHIILSAKVDGSEVILTFQDDGRGINLQRVYQKAVERGLCPASISMNQLRREEILNFVFQSGFSTSSSVSDISGRGVGLDVVRTQVQQLRGNLDVDTLPGQGTTFTFRLPLSLSLLPLLLCQVQQQTLAIPANNVLDLLRYADVKSQIELEQTRNYLHWRNQRLPLVPLMSLLPYSSLSVPPLPPRIVLVVSGSDSPFAITVDSVIDERQLILRSFDDTLPVPAYIGGCTILGTGDAVPVLLPRYFQPLLSQLQTPTSIPPAIRSGRTILVAEDSTGARRSLEQILLQSGFTVITCRDGQEALEQLLQRQSGIDLLISDVEMPRLNGFELLQKVRTHSYWYTLPVVMLTSRTGDRHRQKAASLGANDYLGKPFTPNELLTALNRLIGHET